MTDTHTALCAVKGCPAPKDPDWHKPFCGHGVAGEHQHWPKRSQGGKRIVAFLCHDCHDHIDNGNWGNAVVTTIEDGKRIEIYRAWDLHNKTIIERIIGINDALSDGAEVSDAPASSPRPSASSLKEESDDLDDAGLDTTVSGSGGDVAGGSLGGGAQVSPSDKPAAHAGGDAANDNQPHSLHSGDSPLTHEQRVAIAQDIKDTEWNRQFYAGDTAIAWRAELGEEAEQYLSDFGYVELSLANIMRVCEKVPPPFRNAALRFSHHVVVADLNREDMEMWLDKCADEGWSVAEFRRQVKGTKPKVKRWTLEELETLKDSMDITSWYAEEDVHIDCLRNFLDWLGGQG